MTFRFPWVSRFAYDEMAAELRRRIAEQKSQLEAAEKERQLLLDVLAERGIGRPIYRQAAEETTAHTIARRSS